MRIVYYSYPFFADCDFPLIKTLQDKGIDVHYYMPLPRKFQRSSILEFREPIKKMGFVKASNLEDMQIYKDCIDLNRFYFIKGFPINKFWLPSWILWIYTLWHIKKKHADIVHIDWQFNNNHFEKFLFKFNLGKKKVMTVHDPIMHSGQPNAANEEKKRIQSFKWADNYILLNRVQTVEFLTKYSIDERNVFFSKLPNYNSISKIQPLPSSIEGNYILFFGSIVPYKGLELLLDAMIEVHNVCPSLKLLVAGGGGIYFDISKYDSLDYIVWRHRYIGIGELAGLLKGAQFAVCPYKDATQSGVVHTAFSMGIPVIASDVGALAEDIKDGINGYLVTPCNIEQLASAIIKLATNENLLKKMRYNICNNIKGDRKNLVVADEYIDVYNHLI